MIPPELIERLSKYSPQWADLLGKYGVSALKASIYSNSDYMTPWDMPLDIVSCVRKHNIFGQTPDIEDHTCCIVGEFVCQKLNKQIQSPMEYPCSECKEHSYALWRPVDVEIDSETPDSEIEAEFIPALKNFLDHVEVAHK